MSPEQPQYDPKEAFDALLAEKQAEAMKNIHSGLDERLDWSIREQRRGWGSAAEQRLKSVLGMKTQQVNTEIQRIIEAQLGDLDATEKTEILAVQDAVFKSIQGRIMMGLEMASMDNGEVPTISTNLELARLSEVMGWIENMDIQYMVFQSLPERLKEAYLESLGNSFRLDLHQILEKNEKKLDLTEEDLAVLVNETKLLGSNPDTMQQSQVMMVLGILSLANRNSLVQAMAQEEDFANFAAVLTSMVGSGYLTALAATEAIQSRTRFLQSQGTGGLGKDAKLRKEEVEVLELANLRVNSESMRKTQAKVSEHRIKAAKYYATRSYGHRNRAAGLLTAKGIGSALLTVNGSMTIFANVLMGLHDPMDIPMNPALWLGVAAVGAGLEMSNGHGGIVSTPEEMLAKITKDDNEEKDAVMDQYRQAFQEKLNNSHYEAHFYANYAERIVQVYKAKTKETDGREVPITLEDIGVTKKEDLPPMFRELWEKRSILELKMAEWVAQFSLIDAEAGMKITEASTQRIFIEDARTAIGAKPMEMAELPPFVYTPKK